jgi:hypothetical protein
VVGRLKMNNQPDISRNPSVRNIETPEILEGRIIYGSISPLLQQRHPEASLFPLKDLNPKDIGELPQSIREWLPGILNINQS